MNIGIIGGFIAANGALNASRSHVSRMASMSRMSRMRSSASTHGSSASNLEQETESEEDMNGTVIPVSKAKIIAACEFCNKCIDEQRAKFMEKYKDSHIWATHGSNKKMRALQLLSAVKVCESDIVYMSVKDAAFIGEYTKED